MGILDEGKFREGAREYRAQTQRDIVITLCANALSLFCHWNGSARCFVFLSRLSMSLSL